TVQGAQLAPQVTGLDNGGFVITWTDTSGLDGSGNGVFAQVYGSDGATLGTEFQVNTQNSSTQNAPAIAALDNGFVVTWSSWNVDGNSQGIAAQRYDNSGAQAGVEFVVNTTSAGSQTDPDVAKLSSGGFVVIWTDQAGADGASWGTFAQRFDANGVMVGPEFQVNTHTADSQYEAKIGALSDGGFVVAWRDNSGHDSAGNGVFAQRFDSAGNAVGGEFRVNEVTVSTQYEPDVIGLSDGGFVITWSSWDSDGSSYGISGQQYDAEGHRIDGEFQVNSATVGNQTHSVLAALPNGNFVSAWTAATSGDSGDGSNTGVFQQLWGDPSEFSLQESPELEAFNSEITFQEDIVNAAPQLLDANASVVLVDVDSSDFAGGSLLVSLLSQPEVLLDQYLDPDNLSQDQLGIRNQGVTEGQIGVSGVNVTYGGVVIGTIVSDGANGAALEVDFNSSADDEAVEALLENLTYANTSDDPVATRQYRIQVSDGDGGSSVPHVVTVNIEADRDGVEAVGEEQQVNSFISQDQDEPSIGALTGGGYVITWTSRGQDSSNDGIFAQRFDANGVLVGPELQVNTHVQGDQNDPQVTGLSNGGFVISWTDTSGADGSHNGVFAQVFDGNGLPVGNEFLVNTETSSTQNLSSIASLSGGGFVATWMSNTSGSAGDGNSQGIIAQRFDNSGALIDGEFVVNTTITNNQTDPHIIGLTGGGFVVVWTDQGGADGASWGTFGQRFNADGSTAGGEFQINTSTSGSQYEPSVGALSDGGFVVAWRDDDGLDGNSGAGVFAQRFAANGTEVGGQFRVNEFTSSTQYDPVVIGLDEGGFVITWSSWGADGDSYGISG
ncbi:MAG: hypothetical protein VXZ05_01495, partial [Pseudomonadota bacterium]|nr:hypothetical protein [Pseudomonadota bacterium]